MSGRRGEVLDFRDKEHGGVIRSLDQLKGAVPDPVVEALKADFYAGNFGVRGGDVVGPQVGGQLRKQAIACRRIFTVRHAGLSVVSL